MSLRSQIILVILLLLISVATRQWLLFIVCLALLLAAGATWLWERACLDHVEYRRRFSQRRAFFGEEVELTIEVVNRKLLPLAWLIVEDETPRELEPQGGVVRPTHQPTRSVLTNILSLRWYERVRRHYRLRCDVRGEFTFGPALLRSGDLFGFTSRELVVPQLDQLLVYPKVVPVTRLGLPARDPFGDQAIRHWLFEDPLRTVGVRDYRPGDSPRRIHWGATARAGAIQVKLYEPTITYRMVVFLNIQTAGDAWWWPTYLPNVLELAILTTASVAAWAVEQGYQVGLSANGNVRLSEHMIHLAPSRDPEHLTRILEALARVTPVATRSIIDLLHHEGQRLPFGATVAVVSALLDDDILSELLALQRRGHAVSLLLIGDQPPPPADLPIRIYQIGDEDTWRELTEISVTG